MWGHNRILRIRQTTQIIELISIFLLIHCVLFCTTTSISANSNTKNSNSNNNIINSSKNDVNNKPNEDATCQCGVFLLGPPPLEFGSDAKPVLSGHPVSANCSSKEDKVSCATICRALIQAMSSGEENSPLVQTVILTATRTLACQRFNESHKVPLPRTVSPNNRMPFVKLDELNRKWKFSLSGADQRKRSDVENEGSQFIEHHNHNHGQLDHGHAAELAELSEPKWLGGFYRWCDSQWTYAGVSLQEPLCCSKHLPKKCPSTGSGNRHSKSLKSQRQPRLIIRKRPEDDVSEEEENDDLFDELYNEDKIISVTDPENNDDLDKESKPTSSTKKDKKDQKNSKTQLSKEEEILDEINSVEKEPDNGLGDNESMEMDKISLSDLNPIGQETKRKPLNSTVLAEAFQFVGALMRSLGYGDVVDGVTNVLPQKTASELLERIDVGGWVGTYQEKYLSWSREFNLGYCYTEYGLYNMANEGIIGSAANVFNRVFKPSGPSGHSSVSGPLHQLQHAHSMNSNNYLMSNYINPLTGNDLQQSSSNPAAMYHANPHLYGIPHGNRRVRSAPSKPKRQSPVYRPQTSQQNSQSSSRKITQFEFLQPVQQVQQQQQQQQPVQFEPQQFQLQQMRARKVPLQQQQQQQQQQHHQQQQNGLHRRRNTPPQHHQQQNMQSKDSSTGPSASNNNALMSLANILVQSAIGGMGDGNNGDEGSGGGSGGPGGLLQSALPIVSQVAQSPMIQGMVSNLVTSFLTPPQNGPPPSMHHGKPPLSYQELNNRIPTGSDNSFNQNSRPSNQESQESNEISINPVKQSSSSSSNNQKPPRPPTGPSGGGGLGLNNIIDLMVNVLGDGGGSGSGGSGGGGSNSGVSSMLSQIVNTYLKFITAPDSRKPLPKPTPSSKPQKVNSRPVNRTPSTTESSISSSSSDTSGATTESSGDIVDMISDVAKPFFISWFGVVPDVNGFGQLNINRVDKERVSDFLLSDPDPGSGITDIFFGSVNLPSTGNSLFDFGNRVVYAFSRANEPTQGLYCLKQYSVNKMFDTFKFGVRALFKK